MKAFKKIGFITLIVLLLLSVILYITGHKSVHQEIIINASPEEVWDVLTDTENYKDWNPVMELIEGSLEEGSLVKYRFTQDEQNVMEIPSSVKKVVPNELLNQGGGMPVFLTFNHKYILEKVSEGTKVTIHEDYAGFYVNFWNPEPVEAAYGRLNEALKQRVESL